MLKSKLYFSLIHNSVGKKVASEIGGNSLDEVEVLKNEDYIYDVYFRYQGFKSRRNIIFFIGRDFCEGIS